MNNLTLEVLEAYAGVLSENQANKLYESKTGKQYQKQLFEDNEFHMNLNY